MNLADLPEIAPEETALAVIGVRPVISRAVERVTRGKFNEMVQIPVRIAKAAKSLCHDGLVEVPLSKPNYRTLLRELAEGFQLDQVQEMVDQFPADEHDLAAAFVAKAGSLVQQLQTMLPVSTYSTVSGVRNLVPSDVAVWKFVLQLEVIDDPFRLFSLMGTGSLLKSQVSAARLVYPTLTKAIDVAIRESVLDEKTAKKSWELAPRAETGVKVWMGNPRVDPRLVTALKNAKDRDAAKAQAKQDAAEASGRPALQAKEAMTSTQRALYPGAT